MGWASGSEVAQVTWDLVRDHIPARKRKGIARDFIDAFEAQDCDTIYECDQLVVDAGLEDKYWGDNE